MENKIYTKTGDKGETSLVSGKRVSKADKRVNLYGSIDELNSNLGFLISLLDNNKIYAYTVSFLVKVQNTLLSLSSNLACEKENREKYKIPKIKTEYVKELEKKIDQMEKELIPLDRFILPGGAKAAAYSHICRTVTRKVERLLVFFDKDLPGETPEHAIEFINRLSDYFFVLARYINHLEKKYDNYWKTQE